MRIECYEDASGKWRWRLLAGNNKVIADGSEGYSSRGNMARAIKRLSEMFAETPVVIWKPPNK